MIRLLSLCGLLLLSNIVCANEKILAVVSHKTKIYNNFYEILTTKINDDNQIEMIDMSSLHDKELSDYDTIISIGSTASEALSRRTRINKIIFTLIPSSLAKSIASRPCQATNCKTILIEQPVERYLQLFKYIFPGNKNLAVAITDNSPTETQKLIEISKKHNININIIKIDDDAIIARTLINNLNKNDVLLALPDPYIYNKNTAKSIILSSYHKNVPIIAYSKAFAKAGSLISLYSSLDDIAIKTAESIQKPYFKNNNIMFPDEFSLEVNAAVAKSLNINVNNIEDVKRIIK